MLLFRLSSYYINTLSEAELFLFSAAKILNALPDKVVYYHPSTHSGAFLFYRSFYC